MHDAYEASPILERLPLKIESIACYGKAIGSGWSIRKLSGCLLLLTAEKAIALYRRTTSNKKTNRGPVAHIP